VRRAWRGGGTPGGGLGHRHLRHRGLRVALDRRHEILARRFPEPPRTPRERDRALGVLVRKGYDLELAYDALRRHAGVRDELFD